jgi:hypothetical protein
MLSLPLTAAAQTAAAPIPASAEHHAAAAEFAPSFSFHPRASMEFTMNLAPGNLEAGPRMREPESGAVPFTAVEAHLNLLPLFSGKHQDEAAAGKAEEQSDQEEDREVESYHWKGLLWQSFAFIAAEDGFRLATDHYMRHLVAEGPFWHNYAVSLQHWNMTRWSDGDDFLVDNIGHPMQGAVSAYIEIQNSPSARRLPFSNTSMYWKSRFVAMLWATVFSTQQKIGPLGEAALGNDGGYTYGLHCATEPCRDPNAKYTNNTGWTDFIMTPVGGTAWVIGEDLLDRYVSEKVMRNHPYSVFPKILRGALNPTRTAANALRGKTPWYRDYEHPEAEGRAGVYVDRGAEASWIQDLPRYEIFPHFNALSIPVNTANCWFCRTWTKGGGVGFAVRLSRWIDFDSDVDYQPNISPVPSNRAGGSLLMATFGLRTGFITPNYALKVSVRPGFVSYDHAYLTLPSETNPTPAIGRVTHFATSLSISGDYNLKRHLALRYSFGNTPVRYLHDISAPGIGEAPDYNWLSHETYMTNENWNYQVGPVLRF